MNTVKDSLLLKDHYPETDISVFLHGHPRVRKGFDGFVPPQQRSGRQVHSRLSGRSVEDPATAICS